MSSHADSFRCLDTAARAVPARLDDKHGIYVEQETIVAQRDGRVLVAGNPVFVWRDRGDGFDLLARDSLFGMVIDTGAFVRAIPSPLPGHVLDGMRAAALPNGRWLVSFFEVIPMPPEQAPIAKALWVGETDGITWRDLHLLPLVADSMDIRFLSPLAWKNGRARLAVPFVRDHHRLIALYSLDSSRWTTSVHDVGLLAYVAVALSETRDVMAVVKAAADTVVDVNSLFLYSKNPTDSVWSGGIRVLHAGVDPVRDPIFAADARLLAWRRLRVRERSKEAWFTAVDDEGGPIASPVRIAVGAEELRASEQGGAVLWAIYDRVWPNPTLQLLEQHGNDEPARITRVTSYKGLLAVTIARNRAILVSARAAETNRDPAVISMIETHTWRCLSQKGPHAMQ